MSAKKQSAIAAKLSIEDFLNGKPAGTRDLFEFFIEQYSQIGKIFLRPAKSMVVIATSRRGIAYITQFGKSFIHIVFPFDKPYPDNLCFQKIAQVPGQKQFNHHFRMCFKEDVNKEARKYMKLAYEMGK